MGKDSHGDRLKRLVLITAVGVLASAGAPAVGSAATTVGQTVPPNAGTCGAGPFDVFNTGVSSGTSYVVPSDGVLTSWSTQAGATNTTMKLKAYRSTGTPNQYTVVGASDPQTTLAGTTRTYQARIPVMASDIVGIGGASGDCAQNTGNPADTIEFRMADASPGETATYAPSDPFKTDVSAQLEPDADKDSFGDETQDQCPTDPSTQATCPGPTVSGNAVNNQTLTATKGGNPNNLSFQWLRCDANGNGCVAIPGATGASYKLAFADITHAIRVLQSQRNASGTKTIDSAPTKAVAPEPGRCKNALDGAAGNDPLLGSTGGDLIHGLAGNDNVNGAAGDDCLYGDAGNDKVTGAAGGDRLYGASGRDRLSGGLGNDRLYGGAGNDRISAGAGKNRVSGGSGNDVINTANGTKDTVNCGTGKRDRVRADKNDKLRGCEIQTLV